MLNEKKRPSWTDSGMSTLYITREPFKKEVPYEQIVEFSTQVVDDLVIAWKLYKPILLDVVAAFRARLLEDEPKQLEGGDRLGWSALPASGS